MSQIDVSTILNAIATAAILYTAKSINRLNVQVAVVIEQLGQHDKRLNKLEEEGD